MQWASVLIVPGFFSILLVDDLTHLPPNTWVEIKYKTVQPADLEEKGQFARQGWNKLVYDPDGKRVLFYDRWIDKKHGGYTIYGNCLFALDPAASKLTAVKMDNWTKINTKDGGYRTLARPENDTEPTPCPRHVYHAFEYVPAENAIYICNGANQTALRKDGKLVGHDLCDGLWRLDLKTNRWLQLNVPNGPPNRLDEAMAYSPEIHSLIYAGAGRQLWIFDLAKKEWRKARHSPPIRASHGQTIVHDPTHRRILILGGGPLDGWTKGTAQPFRELYAFNPKTEEVTRLADAPTAFYEAHLAFDSKHKVFITAAVFNKKEQPSGLFCYDPQKDAWQLIQSKNPIPPHNNWFGWTQLCYDAEHDCLIGKINERFFVFRYVPDQK
jgi:hypothetical protein